jgi:hypothetical protein
MRFLIDGQERVLKVGEEVTVAPGSVHAFQNVTDRPTYMISRFEPAEEGPWEELAREGLLLDSTFVQIERAGGLGRVSALQMLVFASRFKQGYPPEIPPWVVDTLAFLIAPTARLFGIHVYYPPPQKGGTP